MRYISLASLLLGLDDLLTKRLAALQSFSNGTANQKLLTAQRDKIAALPAALTGRPLADELDTADARHDGSGGAIWFFVEAEAPRLMVRRVSDLLSGASARGEGRIGLTRKRFRLQ